MSVLSDPWEVSEGDCSKPGDAEEIAPYFCRLDYPLCQTLGLGLERTGTLAQGAPRCDFRFRRGRRTREAPAAEHAGGADGFGSR